MLADLADTTHNPELTRRAVDLAQRFYETSDGHWWASTSRPPKRAASVYLRDGNGPLSGPYANLMDAAEDVDAINAVRTTDAASGPITLMVNDSSFIRHPPFKPTPSRAVLLTGVDLTTIGCPLEFAVRRADGPVTYYASTDDLARAEAPRMLSTHRNLVVVALVSVHDRTEERPKARGRWGLHTFLRRMSLYGWAFLQGSTWAERARRHVVDPSSIDLVSVARVWLGGDFTDDGLLRAAVATMTGTEQGHFYRPHVHARGNPLMDGFLEGARHRLA